MSKTRRIHPVGIMIRFIRELRQLIFPVIALFLFTNNQGLPRQWQLILLGSGLILVFVSGILSWYRFTYRAESGVIEIQSGVIFRRRRQIHKNRIHTISQSAGILQQIFGVVQLRIETAGGGAEPEVRLEAITPAEAKQIRYWLDPEYDIAARQANTDHTNEVNEPGAAHQPPAHTVSIDQSITRTRQPQYIYRLPPSDLLMASFTSASFGVVMAGLAFVVSQFAEYVPDSFYTSTYEWVIAKGVVFITAAITGLALIAWLISVIITVLQFARFTVTLEEQRYKIERGLLEKREVRFTAQKIQAVRFIESPLRQLLGYVTIAVESAGGGDDPSGSIIVVPLIRRKHATRFIKQFLPAYVPAPRLTPSPQRALRKYISRSLWVPLPLVMLAIVLLPRDWSWLSLFVLPVFVLYGWWRWRDTGWKIDDNQMTLRYRTFSRQTIIAYKKRIQAFEVQQSIFQRKTQLINVKAHILAAGPRSFTVLHLNKPDGTAAYQWYSRTYPKSYLEHTE